MDKCALCEQERWTYRVGLFGEKRIRKDLCQDCLRQFQVCDTDKETGIRVVLYNYGDSRIAPIPPQTKVSGFLGEA